MCFGLYQALPALAKKRKAELLSFINPLKKDFIVSMKMGLFTKYPQLIDSDNLKFENLSQHIIVEELREEFIKFLVNNHQDKLIKFASDLHKIFQKFLKIEKIFKHFVENGLMININLGITYSSIFRSIFTVEFLYDYYINSLMSKISDFPKDLIFEKEIIAYNPEKDKIDDCLKELVYDSGDYKIVEDYILKTQNLYHINLYKNNINEKIACIKKKDLKFMDLECDWVEYCSNIITDKDIFLNCKAKILNGGKDNLTGGCNSCNKKISQSSKKNKKQRRKKNKEKYNDENIDYQDVDISEQVKVLEKKLGKCENCCDTVLLNSDLSKLNSKAFDLLEKSKYLISSSTFMPKNNGNSNNLSNLNNDASSLTNNLLDTNVNKPQLLKTQSMNTPNLNFNTDLLHYPFNNKKTKLFTRKNSGKQSNQECNNTNSANKVQDGKPPLLNKSKSNNAQIQQEIKNKNIDELMEYITAEDKNKKKKKKKDSNCVKEVTIPINNSKSKKLKKRNDLDSSLKNDVNENEKFSLVDTMNEEKELEDFQNRLVNETLHAIYIEKIYTY